MGPYFGIRVRIMKRWVRIIDAQYRLVLNDTEISSCRTKSQYQYRYQYLRFANSIPITIPILQIFHFNTNTNTDTSIFKKDTNTNSNTRDFQKRYQYLRFSNKIPKPISIPKYCNTLQSRVELLSQINHFITARPTAYTYTI